MTEALRPMSTGELLDRTFTLYKRNFGLFALIAIPAPALYLAFQLFSAAFASTTLRGPVSVAGPAVGRAAIMPAAIAGVVVVGLAGLLIYMLGWAVTNAAAIRAVSAVYLGRGITARECYASLKGRLGRVIGVFLSVAIRVFGGMLLIYLAAIAIVFMAIAAAATLGAVATIIAGLAGLVAAVVGVILCVSLYVRYSLAVQACIIEDIPVKQALKRSVFLAKGSRSRILTVYTLFFVIQLVMAVSLGAALGFATTVFHSVRLTQAAGALAGFIAGVLAGPLATVAMSLVYYDERVRKEAFDLQLMMAALDGPSASMAVSAT